MKLEQLRLLADEVDRLLKENAEYRASFKLVAEFLGERYHYRRGAERAAGTLDGARWTGHSEARADLARYLTLAKHNAGEPAGPSNPTDSPSTGKDNLQ